MTCIEKIYSVSALVGSSACNANCSFCAGKIYREQANQAKKNNCLKMNFEKNLESAIKLCARYGGWSLSLTGSGEPTMSPDDVTRALEIYNKCANQGAYLPNVNLFSNGISFGDKEFCDKYLPLWKSLGLTNVAVSIHSVNNHYQGQAYGLNQGDEPGDKLYPKFEDIFSNIKNNGIGVRCTLLLNKGVRDGVATCKDYIKGVVTLINVYGINNITSWPVGNPDGSRNEFTPSRCELYKINLWLSKNAKRCHEHSWGGGVYDLDGNILRLTDYVTKHDPKKDFVRQLVVFQNGDVCYSWIKEGALCMK